MEIREKKYFIYVYIINKYVYVGLTMDIDRRFKEHSSINSKLSIFCSKNNYKLSDAKILEEGLTSIEAQSKEENWIDYYKSKGYTILNIGKTGIYKSSLGGCHSNGSGFSVNISDNMKVKYAPSYEECYKESEKYKTRVDFKLGNLKLGV